MRSMGTAIRKPERPSKWQNMFTKNFNYNPDETYHLSLEENPYGGSIFGLKDIVRQEAGDPVDRENGVVCSTIRMGFGHYRIAMAGVSCARAWAFSLTGWICWRSPASPPT